MKPEWVEIIPPQESPSHPATFGMNVPGGCLIMVDLGVSPVFIHGVAFVKEDEAQGGGFRFVSTVAEDMDKALGPFRQLIALFQGIPGMPVDPPAS